MQKPLKLSNFEINMSIRKIENRSKTHFSIIFIIFFPVDFRLQSIKESLIQIIKMDYKTDKN